MKIEQIIIDALRLTEQTQIPLLFLSNPGLGKTTILKKYAKEKGYHLETLIGSRFTPEEISGYQVNNGDDHLQHINPEWFNRILEKDRQGITTLLFLDEICTASESVQGALLNLIFDRSIGCEKKLPDSCVIVSAANYAGNLPDYMNIMTPTLNRFILINLNEGYGPMDLLDEFIESENPDIESYKVPSHLPENFEALITHNYKEYWKEIFLKYSDPEAALGYLDISNMNLDGLYSDSENYIYNHISGRSISYLLRTLIAYKKIGMKNKILFEKVIDGLVGAGTCSFKNTKQAEGYRKFVHTLMHKLISNIETKYTYLPLVGDIVKDVQTYIINRENTGFYQNENITQLVELIEQIRSEFTPEKILNSLKNNAEIAKFTSQMEAVIELQQIVSQYPDSSNLSYELTRIAMDYYGLYCEILNLQPDFQNTFGCSNNLFKKVVFLSKTDKKGNTKYSKAALRPGSPNALPSLYFMNQEEGLLSADLKKVIHDSDNVDVVYYDKGIHTVHSCEYLKNEKKFAS